VIGVDQSAAMLKAARRRTAGLDNVDLRQGGLEALPIEDAACDGALLLLALTYVDDPEAAAAELSRIVRPGGRAVLVDLLRHDRDDFREAMGQQRPGFETAELSRLLAGSGFEAVRVRALPPAPEARGPALLVASGVRAAHPSVEKLKGDNAR
jgi:ArsR family transcriptional regulator